MCSLHERLITVASADGQEENILAIDASRVEKVEFLSFIPPPLDVSDQGSVDAWVERANYIIEDLQWLIRLPYDRFWCQNIFDTSLHRCIVSYLSEARRPHDIVSVYKANCAIPAEVDTLILKLHRLYFLVCLRSSTHHESQTNFIDAEVFGEILYENYIFDIPRLMDICVVYGHGNDTALVTKMIDNVFKQQPKYNKDLSSVVPTIQKVLETLCAKCGVDIETGASPPPKLPTTSRSVLESMSTGEFEDIVLYLSDVAHTLNSFLKIYPSATNRFWESQGFLACLATAYECFAVAISAAFKRRSWDDVQHAEVVKRQFRRSQVCLLRIFRLVVYHACLRPIVDGAADESKTADAVEGYLGIMNAVLGEKHFIAHLQVLFPFGGDRTIISQSSHIVDEPRLRYIEDAFKDAATKHGRKQREKLDMRLEEFVNDIGRPTEQFEYEGPDEDDVCWSDVAGANLDSMVSAVHELLPELGRGFIELCLDEFDNDVEKVVNALLEDKLPPNLQGVERSLETALDTSAGVNEQSASLLAQRRNVFDGDEFDVFSRSDIDLDRIHQGKRDRKVTDGLAREELDPEVRARCAAYALQPVTVTDDLENVCEYDDEYDDTYDSNIVGAGDADSADEMMARRPFVVPRVFAEHQSDSSSTDRPYDDDVEEDSDEVGAVKPRDAFVEDPALLRQRREQQWAAQQQQKTARRRAPAGHRGKHADDEQREGAGRTHDVKGAARGQGQSTEVLRNRAWKEKNKGSRVNHNRKDLADRKRRI